MITITTTKINNALLIYWPSQMDMEKYPQYTLVHLVSFYFCFSLFQGKKQHRVLHEKSAYFPNII